jgi:hypothetical protein
VIQAKETKEKLKNSMTIDRRQSLRMSQAPDLELSQMRRAIREMEVRTSQAKLNADRDKSELESLLDDERIKIIRLEKEKAIMLQQIEELNCDNGRLKLIVEEFSESLTQC